MNCELNKQSPISVADIVWSEHAKIRSGSRSIPVTVVVANTGRHIITVYKNRSGLRSKREN